MTTTEILKKAGISRARLWELRNHKTSPRRLIEGEDWDWVRGKIVYTESALKKIQSKKIYKERK